MARNHHEILGVSTNASHAEVKAAFRKLAHRYHPDISTEADAQEKFVEVVEAYRAITQGKSRVAETIYSSSSSINSSAANNSFSNKSSFTNRPSFTNGPSTNKSSADKKENGAGPQKGCDCHMDAKITVEELYWGVELKVDPEVACHGRRSQKGWHNKSLVSVNVPRGTQKNTRLRLRGKGKPGKNGGTPGDIYLTITLKPHERYDVSGDNLYVDMPLSRWEAQEGAMIDVVTPGGRVEVSVPAGIASGQSIRIPNRGLPRTASETGDLFAIARVVSASTRASNVYKWPHIPHAGTVRWQAVNSPRGGESIDVRV